MSIFGAGSLSWWIDLCIAALQIAGLAILGFFAGFSFTQVVLWVLS